MKMWFFLVSTLLILSCGKSSGKNSVLITYNVPSKIYNQYKAQLDAITADITSKSGKQLVQFISNGNDPKYSTAHGASNSTNEAWVYIKEASDQFTELSNSASAMSLDVGSPSNPTKVIVLNFFVDKTWSAGNFRQILSHEVLHCLGFYHYPTENSIMNPDVTRTVIGLTAWDKAKLAADFPFSMEGASTKDLEKFAAFVQGIEAEDYAYNLVQNFGLSESRAIAISKLMVSYNKIQNTRELTSSEKDSLSNQIMGFGFEKGKSALEKYLQGNKESIDDLITIAADKNGTTPEHIKELFGELFLK